MVKNTLLTLPLSSVSFLQTGGFSLKRVSELSKLQWWLAGATVYQRFLVHKSIAGCSRQASIDMSAIAATSHDWLTW